MNPSWSCGTPPQLGLALAAETGHLLTWAEPPQITLWQRGEILHQRQAALPLQAGACSSDGTAFAIVARTGRLWGLGADLRTRWELQLPEPAVALALDPLGNLLAVSDVKGGLHLIQAVNGRAIWRVESARPLRYLAFVPEKPLLIGAADTALVAAYDPAGNCRWRNGLAAHIGSLAVVGDGKLIVLATYGEGACCFDTTGHRLRNLSKLGPSRRLVLTYDGRLIVQETLGGQLVLTTSGGVRLSTFAPTGRVLDLAISPLGERIVLLVEGGLQELSVTTSA